MRKVFRPLAVLLIAAACATAADAPQPADQVLAAAESAAAAQHKNVWVIFGASWCGWCRHLDQLIADPQAGPILNRHFVITHLTVQEHGDKASLNSPGGEQVENHLGGGTTYTGLPFFAFVDSRGQILVNSNRAVAGKPGGNIGFPSAPEEVDWFMTMLRRAAPSLSPGEAQIIADKLRTRQ